MPELTQTVINPFSGLPETHPISVIQRWVDAGLIDDPGLAPSGPAPTATPIDFAQQDPFAPRDLSGAPDSGNVLGITHDIGGQLPSLSGSTSFQNTGVTLQQIADATGRPLSDVISDATDPSGKYDSRLAANLAEGAGIYTPPDTGSITGDILDVAGDVITNPVTAVNPAAGVIDTSLTGGSAGDLTGDVLANPVTYIPGVGPAGGLADELITEGKGGKFVGQAGTDVIADPKGAVTTAAGDVAGAAEDIGAPSDPGLPFDPLAVIQESAKVNRYNQETPFGTVTWEQDENGQWKQTTAFSEETGGAFSELVDQIMNQPRPGLPTDAEGGYGVNIPEFSNLNPDGTQKYTMPTMPEQNYDTSDVEKAQFDLMMSYLQPQMTKEQDRLTQVLANEGLPTGSGAFSERFGDLYGSQDESMRRAAWESVMAGKDESSRLFDQDMRQYDAELKGLAQQFGMDMDTFKTMLTSELSKHGVNMDVLNTENLTRDTGIRELSSLVGGLPSQPGMPIDVTGPYSIANQNNLMDRQQSQSFWDNVFGLGGTLGAAALMG